MFSFKKVITYTSTNCIIYNSLKSSYFFIFYPIPFIKFFFSVNQTKCKKQGLGVITIKYKYKMVYQKVGILSLKLISKNHFFAKRINNYTFCLVHQDLLHHVKKQIIKALAGVAQWIEFQPVNQRVMGSIPNQGTCLGCQPGPQ